MNTSNRRLLKAIRIFFQVVYGLVILFIVLTFLGLFLTNNDTDKSGIISSYIVIKDPALNLHHQGTILKSEMVYGFTGVLVHNLPVTLKIINVLAPLISFAFYILILICIRGIIRSASRNEVFSLANARRLKNIGFLLLVNLVISYFVIFYNTFTLQKLESFGLGSMFGMVLAEGTGMIVAIVFTFFMAALFKIGVSLQEENQSFV